MDNARLAEQIRADRIDILFDLSGHTGTNRLVAFARKPAPIQITWIAYEGTTGLAAMDYILADRHLVRPEDEPYYTEQVLRLPDGYVCYQPPQLDLEPGPLPALTAGHVTFGSFQNLTKVTPQVVAVWSEILRRVPEARLALKYSGFDLPATRQRYRELFAAQGIDAARLDLLGWSPYAEFMALYQRTDLTLDPFPFCGGLTTCESLWMGVPVITLPGATFAGRHSLSYLTNIGLPETIARDLEHYVELAVGWAGDLPRLAELRSELAAHARLAVVRRHAPRRPPGAPAPRRLAPLGRDRAAVGWAPPTA